MGNAKRDDNSIPTLLAVSNADGITPVTLYADPTTHRLLVSLSSDLGDLSNVTITSEAQGDILYFNGTAWVNLAPGTSGKVLQTNGAAANPSWESAGSGDVTKVGTPVNSQIGVWTGDGTIEGASSLTYDGSNLQLTGDIGSTGTRITKGWFADLTVTNAIAGSVTGNAGTVSTITGLAPDTATTQATQPNITSLGTLTALNTGANGMDVNPGSDIDADLVTVAVTGTPTISWSESGDMFELSHGLKLNSGLLTVGTINATTYRPNANDTTMALQGRSFTSASGVDIVLRETATIVGSGTAGYTAFEIDVTETSIGSGANNLMDLKVGSVSKFAVDNTGAIITGNADAVVSAASVTVAGKVELATTAEVDTGTDSTRAMSVDQFVASKRNIRWLVFNLVEAATDCAAATNIAGDFVSPIAGTILQSDTTPFYLYATNSTAGTTGTMVVDISIGGTTIMTTNKLDFDTTEKTTTTAATPPELTTTALAVGDIITIDIDAIHTTAAKGLTVYMAVRE